MFPRSILVLSLLGVAALPAAAPANTPCHSIVHGGFVASQIHYHLFGPHGCRDAHTVIEHVIENGGTGVCYVSFRCTHTALDDGGAHWSMVKRHGPKATLTFTLHPHTGG